MSKLKPASAAADPSQVPLRRRVAELPRPVWVVCTGMFLNKLGNFLNVFLVLYLTQKGDSAFLAGTALGAVGFGSFFGNMVGGTVADRLGRRAAIVVSMFGAAGLILLVPLSPAIYWTIALAAAIGFFAQLYRPAGGAILVDTVAPDQRVTAFGLFRLAINLGMSVGPMIGGLLSGANYDYLFIGNAAACASFGLLAALLLPETKPEPSPPPSAAAPTAAGAHPPRRREGYLTVFSDPALRLYLLAIFAANYVYSQTTSTLPLHVRHVGQSNSFYGLLLGLNALLCVLIELPLTRYTGRWHPGRVLAVGMVLQSLGVGLTGLADTRVTLVATVVLWSVAETIYTPVGTAYPGLLSPEHLRGRYQGSEGIAVTLAQSVGPALGGFLYAAGQTLHWTFTAIVGLAGALVILPCPDPRTRGELRPATPAHESEASVH